MSNPESFDKDKIFIVVPVYNEGETLRKVLLSLLSDGYRNIVMIDDGSSKDPVSILKDIPVIFIRHSINLGQGAALQTGFEYTRMTDADILITFDADGQHDTSDLGRLIAPLVSEKVDIVLGSRFLAGGNSDSPLSRKILLQLARLINFMFSGLLLSDAHNGLRAMNRTALDKINIRQNRMAHASEILLEIKRHRLAYKEVPVTIRYTDYTKKKGQRALDSVNILFDLLFKKTDI